jgi:hypothetical protein
MERSKECGIWLRRNFSRVPGLPDGIFSDQKVAIWVNLGGSCNGRCWYILWIFYGPLIYNMDI